MIDRETLLSRLEIEGRTDVMDQLRRSLHREETRVLAARSTVSVSEAMRLWTTRLRNTDITGQQLRGAEPLLERLSRLAKQRKLEQIGIIGSDVTGNLFFDGSTREFLGAIVVDSES